VHLLAYMLPDDDAYARGSPLNKRNPLSPATGSQSNVKANAALAPYSVRSLCTAPVSFLRALAPCLPRPAPRLLSRPLARPFPQLPPHSRRTARTPGVPQTQPLRSYLP
jgi:hypothetical protein